MTPRAIGVPPLVPKPPGFLVDWRTATAGRANIAQCGLLNSFARETLERANFVNNRIRQGSLSLEMEVQQDDVDSGSTERVQLRPTNPPRSYFSEGEEIWLAFSVWLQTGFFIPETGVDWVNLYDGIPNTPGLAGGALSTAVALNINDQPKFVLAVNGGQSVEGNPYPHNSDIAFGAPTLNVWHDFLIHMVLESDASGVTEIWHDETAQADARGIMPTFTALPDAKDTGPNVPISTAGTHFVQYPQFGIYRHTNPQTSKMNFGGVSGQATREMAEALWRG